MAGEETRTADGQLTELEGLRMKLQEQLGIYRDPFLFANTVERTLGIWTNLLMNYPALKDVRDATHKAMKEYSKVDPRLESQVVTDAQKLLSQPGADSHRIAAVVEALRKLEMVHNRDVPPEPQPDQKQESKDNKDKKQDGQKKQQKKDKQKQPPEYPEIGRKYKAHNKDTDKSGGGQGDEATVAKVDKYGVRYFGIATYQIVDARTNEWAQVAITGPVQVHPSKDIDHYLTVYPTNKVSQDGRLIVPQGFVPLTFDNSNGKVWQDETGNYFFHTKHQELKVPLLTQGKAARPLAPSEIEIYTSPSGAKLGEWPEHLQQAVHTLKAEQTKGAFSGSDGHVKLARVLGAYIANHFKYRVDADPEGQSAMQLAHNGAFQCDTAATILTSLLRDEFQVPSRPKGGFKGKPKLGESDTSHVVMPGEGHAWVEVADAAGNWWGVDPTPKQKDRETKKDGDQGESEYGEFPQESSQEQQEGQGQSVAHDGSPQEQKDGDKQKSLADLIKDVKQLQESKAKDRKNSQQKQGGDQGQHAEQNDQNADSKNGHENGEEKAGKEGQSKENDQSVVREGSDELLNKIDEKNPLVKRLLQRSGFWALQPDLSTIDKRDRIQLLKAALGEDKDGIFQPLQRFKSVLGQASQFFLGNHPSLDMWAQKIIHEAPKMHLNETADQLVKLQKQIEFTMKFSDPEEARALQALWNGIQSVRRALMSVKHPDSTAIRIAQEMFQNLPGDITKRVIREKFGLTGTLGDDVATLSLAKAISEGKLNDERLLSILGPHTEFLTDPINTPSQGERRTWEMATRRQRGRSDILMTNDPRLRRKFVRIHTQYSDAEALKRGEMGVMMQRRRYKVPAGAKDTDPEKATVLCIDLSGSMQGDLAYFQSMFTGALVDRALSDVNPMGKARHRVYILPFGSDVYDPIEVTSPEQAAALVRDLKNKTANQNSGTDIQKALIKAAEILQAANGRGPNPKKIDKALARATVIVASDGGSNVDSKAVKEAFDQVGNETDILMGFVAIGGTNPQLVELSENASLGGDKSIYIEWNNDDIQRVLTESKAPAVPVNDFWTKHDWASLPPDVRWAFSSLQQSLGEYRGQLQRVLAKRGSTQATRRMAEQVKIPVLNRPKSRPKNTAALVIRLRRVLNQMGPALSPQDRRLLLEEVLEKWSEYVPDPVQSFDHGEIAELIHLLAWPQFGEANALSDKGQAK